MTRYAVGDIQGCDEELQTLLERLKFSADRDQVWFVGDLVNRGPDSLPALRRVRSLGDNAVVVLGNHDLHLLAVAHGARRPRPSDTLEEVLAAPDRDVLLEWLITRPLAHAEGADLMVHAGLVPQWTVAGTLALAREVGEALRHDPRALFEHMYGNEPDRWDERLAGVQRLRFAINVLTRLRVCTADGRVDLGVKGEPPSPPSPLRPWFAHAERASREARVIFGHWSALGLVREHGVIGLDTGCVWGGALSAVDLDSERAVISVPCTGYQRIGAD
ncbi:MAG: symmetrical bis(5'-nucleosyl)-tetraphosphatase [Gammaproteobacteria bacterium]|nr:MAG: symmetrical bis(5'-nucleosyl)-tetraphosphatase [Gammaproteobacteria bacterium]